MTGLAPGTEFDRYRVESILGEGGTATVFLVRHRTLRTQRALKVLHVANQRLQERLQQEALILSTLEHPNIVRIIDALDVDGCPAVVMEYVAGPSLDRFLQETPPGLALAESIFLGILAGVERAHKAGIIHRDLKPANVLLMVDGAHITPKVADFGIARIVGEAEGTGPRMTKTGATMGTASYMPPEQIMDAATVDQRADVWALGCILYELVTNRLAFDEENFMETFDAIRQGRYVPAVERVRDLPTRVDNTIKACLMLDRERRPADCAAVRAMLQGNGSTAVPYDSSSVRAPPVVPRRQAAPDTFNFDASSFRNPIPEPPQVTVNPEADPSGASFHAPRWPLAAGLAGLVLVLGAAGIWTMGGSTPAVVIDPPRNPALAGSPSPGTDPALPLASSSASQGTPGTDPGSGTAVPRTSVPAATPPAPKPPRSSQPAKPSVSPVAGGVVPAVTPVAAAATAATGRIVVTGATRVSVKDASGATVKASAAPEGHYTVFGAWGERSANVGVDVVAGETVNVVCDEGYGECTVR